VDAIERLLHEPGAVKPRLLYLIPYHDNPTATTLTAERRARLVQLAHTHGFFILADEVYQFLDWSEGSPPPRMASYDVADAQAEAEAGPSSGLGDFDGEDHAYDDKEEAASAGAALEPRRGACVLSISSLTKILAPGVRLGWIEANPRILKYMVERGFVIIGGGLAPVMSEVVARALDSGWLWTHVERLCAVYSARASALCAACEAEAANGVAWTFVRPSGGFFLFLRLPAGVRGDVLARAAAAAQTDAVRVLAGARCAVPGTAEAEGGPHQHVRICFALLPEHQLREGVRRLANAVRALTNAS